MIAYVAVRQTASGLPISSGVTVNESQPLLNVAACIRRHTLALSKLSLRWYCRLCLVSTRLVLAFVTMSFGWAAAIKQPSHCSAFRMPRRVSSSASPSETTSRQARFRCTGCRSGLSNRSTRTGLRSPSSDYAIPRLRTKFSFARPAA